MPLRNNQPCGSGRFERCPADTYILAAFAWRRLPAEANKLCVLDLGCGPGRVLYELSRKRPGVVLFGLDIQPEMLEDAHFNLNRRGVPVEKRDSLDPSDAAPGVIHLMRGNLRHLGIEPGGKKFDAILVNAPYFAEGQGRIPPDPVRAQYRHELSGGIRDFLDAAIGFLAPGGSILTIYPPRFAGRLEEAAVGLGLRKTAEQVVYPNASADRPGWWLAQWKTGPADGETEILAPVKDPDAYMEYPSK